MSTVINNRLNNVMKYLAAITIVMSIPTIISGTLGHERRWQMDAVFVHTAWFRDHLRDNAAALHRGYALASEEKDALA